MLEEGFNNCNLVDLSSITKKNGFFHFKEYFLEDYFLELFENLEIKYEQSDKMIKVDCEDIDLDILNKTKAESYSATVW
jgi:hypothetical protein